MYTSIFDQICEALSDEGTLAEDFYIPTGRPEDDWASVPGGWDGMAIYQIGLANFEAVEDDDEDYLRLLEMVRKAAAGDFDAAQTLLEDFAAEESFLFYRDKLLAHVIETKDCYNKDLFLFAIIATRQAHQVEAVKTGLGLLYLFNTNSLDELKDLVRTLAAYDEFSLYCGSIMESWDDGNEEIFEAARRVTGWGRIHLVRSLEPRTDEIRAWLLRDCVPTADLSMYLALLCYRKTGLFERLLKPMDYEEYRGAAEIIEALVLDEDGKGMTAIKERGKLLERYLKATSERDDLTGADYRVILDLVEYFESDDVHMPKLEARARSILNDDARRVVQAENEAGESFDVARRLGISSQPQIFQAVLADPEKNSYWAGVLLGEGYRVDELLDHIERSLDMDAYGPERPAGQEDGLFYQDLYHDCLRGLGHHVGKGGALIRTGLVSWRESLRYQSLLALEKWVEKSGKPLFDMAPEMHDYLTAIAEQETNHTLYRQMLALIKGENLADTYEDDWLKEQLDDLLDEFLGDDDDDDDWPW
ncbi:MAG: hypothetical protein QM270_01270 [Bacillota bacterium]|nr:hypothetical protein [Bacillota bacterium]